MLMAMQDELEELARQRRKNGPDEEDDNGTNREHRQQGGWVGGVLEPDESTFGPGGRKHGVRIV